MNATARVFGQPKAREAPSRSDFGAGAPTRRMAAWAAGSVGNPAARHSLCVLNRAGPCLLKALGGVI
jgi:hypothetical protein